MAVTKHRLRKSRKVHRSRKSRKVKKGGVGSSSPKRRSSSEKRSFERRETERAAHTVRVLKGTAARKAATVAEKASAAAARDSFERREKLRLEASERRIENPLLRRPHKK